MSKKILIGVAWPYVNGDLHLGHLAGYLLPADIFARFHRLRGNDVLMVSGSDCHGTPITVAADKLKLTPAEVVARFHPQDNCSSYIRSATTSTPRLPPKITSRWCRRSSWNYCATAILIRV